MPALFFSFQTVHQDLSFFFFKPAMKKLRFNHFFTGDFQVAILFSNLVPAKLIQRKLFIHIHMYSLYSSICNLSTICTKKVPLLTSRKTKIK